MHSQRLLFTALLAALPGCADAPGGASDLGQSAPAPDLSGPGSPSPDLSSPSSTDGGASCSGGAASTAGVQCGYKYSGFNASPSVNANSTVTWSCTATQRSLTGNGLPDHATGVFPNPNCPNAIAAQSVTASMPLAPALTGQAAQAMVVGYVFNGVKLDPATAGSCTVSGNTTTCSLIGNAGNWNIEALGQSSFNFGVDSNNAHVQPGGAYHYHGMPTGFINQLGKGQAMTLVGYALDGFPVYARYGYNDPKSAASGIKVVTSSFKVKASPDAGRPAVATYPMGAFSQDYQYVAGSGDLDECNGRTGVTPEFPCGIYHYYITDSYPYIQRCLKGTVAGGGGGGPRACTTSNDCAGACPPGSKGCGCSTTPMGMQCIPTCTVSADCPLGPAGQVLSCRSGFCAP